MDPQDWNLLKAFLATAESGSLSAAARRLGLVQSTLSRQVAALEAALGATLFERLGRSMVLTEAGQALLPHAQAMRAAADELRLVATGQSKAAEGVVSVSAADTVAAFLLPPLLPRLQRQAPGLVLELVTSNAVSDLRRREADIAVRHMRPVEPDLIGRLVRQARASFYASRSWVQAHGHPRRASDLGPRMLIGTDRAGTYLDYLRQFGIAAQQDSFAAYSENLVTLWCLAQAGMGIAPMMDEIAAATPGVVKVLDELPPIEFPIWLVTHRELRTARRIRIVFDFLADALASPPAGR